jgi:hypothetical protein
MHPCPTWKKEDDVPQTLQAFEVCNNGGTVVFQNHAAGFIISAERIPCQWLRNSQDQCSGSTWYPPPEAGETQPERPMPFVFWNVSDVLVEHCELNTTSPHRISKFD